MQSHSYSKPQLATISDKDEILSLYKLATLAMESNGIFQWDKDYPSKEDLVHDLIDQSLWCIKQDYKIIATITLDAKQEIQFEKIIWAYTRTPILVIHRVCVHPHYQRLGLAGKLLEFAEKHAQLQKIPTIRLDAYLGNAQSQRLYKKHGYHEAIGYCYYHPAKIMCNCFEKNIV
jgi:ribosomal protein S18 acetylase RimI-like enzyme